MLIKPQSTSFVRVMSPLTTIYASLKSHKSDCNIAVLNLIYLLDLYLSSALPDWSWTSIHFLVINLGPSSGFVPNKFAPNKLLGIPFLYGIKTILSHQ